MKINFHKITFLAEAALSGLRRSPCLLTPKCRLQSQMPLLKTRRGRLPCSRGLGCPRSGPNCSWIIVGGLVPNLKLKSEAKLQLYHRRSIRRGITLRSFNWIRLCWTIPWIRRSQSLRRVRESLKPRRSRTSTSTLLVHLPRSTWIKPIGTTRRQLTEHLSQIPSTSRKSQRNSQP
jgi:hypothetical protein